MVILTNPSSLDESFSSGGEDDPGHRSEPNVTFHEDPDEMSDDVFHVETQASVHQPTKPPINRPNIIVNNFTNDLARLPRKPSIRIKPMDDIVERDCEIEGSDEDNHDQIKVIQDVEDEDDNNCLHPGGEDGLSDCSRRTSEISLYQQQRRVRLSIPFEPGHRLSVPSSDNSEVLWSDPNIRDKVFRRRTAVHGLSPNTNLSIGAVM